MPNIIEANLIAEGKKFNILTSSIFNPDVQRYIHERHFDIVIALNIFHHFLKTKVIFTEFKKWLPTLSSKTMFFQPHLHSEEQMNNSYLNFTEEEFVQFILKETSLNSYEIIHKAVDGRRVYRLY